MWTCFQRLEWLFWPSYELSNGSNRCPKKATVSYHDDFGVTLAGGDNERRPPGGGLLVNGQLDLPGMQVAQDLLQRRHISLGGHVVEHGLLLLQAFTFIL